MGWDIIRHSFGMLYRNLGNALRISVGPILVALVVGFLLLGVFGSGIDTLTEEIEQDKLSPGLALALLLNVLLFFFMLSWIAVAWHRFILLEDYPGLLPPLTGRPVWHYVGKTLLLVLVILLVTIPAMIVIAMFASVLMGPISTFILSTLNVGLALYVSNMWLRFAIVLPATAVGRPMGFGEAWRATSPYSSAILGAGIIIVLINAAVSMFSAALPGLPALIVTVLANWISVMLNISILTTLYGVIVERRTL